MAEETVVAATSAAVVKTFTPPAPLSDAALLLIHAGLVIPSAAAILSMSRELRMWRGDPHPDAV